MEKPVSVSMMFQSFLRDRAKGTVVTKERSCFREMNLPGQAAAGQWTWQ